MNANSLPSESCALAELISQLDSLPPHDPDRFETVDGLDNPSCTNGMRAEFTIQALEFFQEACHMQEDPEVAVGDLIGDLLHLVHSLGHNPREVLEVALANFLAEAS